MSAGHAVLVAVAVVLAVGRLWAPPPRRRRKLPRKWW